MIPNTLPMGSRPNPIAARLLMTLDLPQNLNLLSNQIS